MDAELLTIAFIAITTGLGLVAVGVIWHKLTGQ